MAGDNPVDLTLLVKDQTNLVELYWFPTRQKETHHADQAHAVHVGWRHDADIIVDHLSRHFGHPSVQNLVEYCHRDIYCSYDLSNDGQRVYRRLVQGEHMAEYSYTLIMEEDVLPPHKWPCVAEITMKSEIQRHSFRVSNRMFVVVDSVSLTDSKSQGDPSVYVYIKYNHDSKVDLAKMQSDLNKTMGALRRNLPRTATASGR